MLPPMSTELASFIVIVIVATASLAQIPAATWFVRDLSRRVSSPDERYGPIFGVFLGFSFPFLGVYAIHRVPFANDFGKISLCALFLPWAFTFAVLGGASACCVIEEAHFALTTWWANRRNREESP